MPAAALEILDDTELQRVLLHARTCADCAQLLEEYRQVTVAISLRLPGAGKLDPDRSAVLLVHHSVHRPLDYGWLASGALLAILIAVGIYAAVQRRRTSALEDRIVDLKRRK